MTTRTDNMSRTEKNFWIVFACILFFGELWATQYQKAGDDRNYIAATAAEDSRFKEILRQNRDNFNETVRGMEGILESSTAMLSKENLTLAQTMGSSGYPYFLAVYPSNNPSPQAMWPVFVFAHGYLHSEKGPFVDVTVDISEEPTKSGNFDQEAVESMMHPKHYNLGTLVAPSNFVAPFQLQSGKRYNLFITTRRGSFREEIRIDPELSAAGGWHESWCLYGRYNEKLSGGRSRSIEKLLDGKCD